MADRSADVILRYKVDQASQRAAERSVDSIENNVDDLRARMDRLQSGFRNVYTREQALIQSGASSSVAAPAGRRANAGQLVNIGTRALSEAGLGEAGQAINIVDDLARSLGQFGIAGAASVGILAGFTLGLAALDKQLESSKIALNAAIGAQEAYYKAVQTSTSDQVRAQIEQLRQGRAVLQTQIDETRQTLEAAFQQTAGAISDPLARILDATGRTPFQALNEQLQDLQKQATQSDLEIARLTQGLSSNAFAANDARAAIDQLTKSLQSNVEQAAQDAADRVRFQDRAATSTRDQLREMIRERNVELEALQAARAEIEQRGSALENSEELLQQNTLAIALVRQNLADLNAELANTGRARDTWDAVKNFFKGAVDTVTDIGARVDRAGDINRRIAEIRGKGFEDLAKVELDLQRRILEITQDTAERRTDILRDAQDAERESLRDYTRERARIERDANRQLLSAVGRRDVLAFVEAQRSRDDALSDLQENLNEERQRRQQAAERQLSDLARNEQRTIDRLRVSAQQQAGIINQRVQQEVRAQQVLLAQTLGFTQSRVSVEVQGYQTIVSVATSAISQIARAWASLGGAARTTSGTGGTGTGTGTGGRAVRTAYSSTEEYLRAARTALVTDSSYPGGR